jgi:hypothetical protein
LQDVEVRRRLENKLHFILVQLLVGLRARAPHGGAFAAVEHLVMNTAAVGGDAHQTTQGIDLAHHVAFRDTTDRRVAAHLPNRVERHRHEQRLEARLRADVRGVAAGMARTDDDRVVLAGVLEVVVSDLHASPPAILTGG